MGKRTRRRTHRLKVAEKSRCERNELHRGEKEEKQKQRKRKRTDSETYIEREAKRPTDRQTNKQRDK